MGSARENETAWLARASLFLSVSLCLCVWPSAGRMGVFDFLPSPHFGPTFSSDPGASRAWSGVGDGVPG